MLANFKKYFLQPNKSVLILVILSVASCFTYLCATRLSHPGDQEWFADVIRQFDYDYIAFALYRYQTWSSRLIWEAATAFFSVHQYIFLIMVFLSSILLISTVLYYFWRQQKFTYLTFGVPMLFWIFFDIRLFTSAGIIATVTNYFFPMVAFALAFFLKEHESKWLRWCAIPCLLFVVMHEQFALVTFLLTVNSVIVKNPKSMMNRSFLTLSVLGLASILLCPGNELRKVAEISQFFPEFEKFGLLQRTLFTFLDTSNMLFAGRYGFMLSFFTLVCVFAFLRKRYIAFTCMTIPFLFILASMYRVFGFELQANLEVQIANPYRTVRYSLFYLLLYLLIALAIIFMFDNMKKGLRAFSLILTGFTARMALAMSPTMFASENRTLVPFVFMLFVVAIQMLVEMEKVLYDNSIKISG